MAPSQNLVFSDCDICGPFSPHLLAYSEQSCTPLVCEKIYSFLLMLCATFSWGIHYLTAKEPSTEANSGMSVSFSYLL